ncbi:MAG TPA: hypothetical protein VFH55_11675 [Nitrospiria bacterium]|nr:hypothetical protein [Nitrospiria bacterium]
MGGKTKKAKPEVEKRGRWDRRDPLRDRRQEDRRMNDRRKTDRRRSGRRKDFCPTCGGELTPTAYCPSCKIRVVKVRISGKR